MDLRVPRKRSFWASHEASHNAEILLSFQTESGELADGRLSRARAVSKGAYSSGRSSLKKRDRTFTELRVSNQFLWYTWQTRF
jgi:hypothetical protein